MAPERLKMLTALQRLFNEKMGEWQDGWDRFTCEELDVTFDECGLVHLTRIWVEVFDRRCSKCIRIPLTIDDRNPERGLLGMIDGIPHIWKHSKGWSVRLVATNCCFEADTPTDAILKALCEQEGIEI